MSTNINFQGCRRGLTIVCSGVLTLCLLFQANLTTVWSKNISAVKTEYSAPATASSCALAAGEDFPEVADWVRNNQDVLSKKIPLLKELNSPQTDESTVKKMVLDPQLVSDTWTQVMRVMTESSAPDNVKTQAKRVAQLANDKDSISMTDRRAIVELVDRLKVASSGAERENIIKGSVERKQLSSKAGADIIRRIRANAQQSGIFQSGDVFFINTSFNPLAAKPISALCIAGYCVPILGILTFAVKSCRG